VGGLTAGVSPMDRKAVRNWLVTMRNSVGQLSSAGPIDRARLACDPSSGLVVERMLALLADLAFDINRQAAAALGEAPESPTAAFSAAARAGLIDERLAMALTPPDGPHHLLVQQYLDTEPERVAGVVSDAVAAYREYIRQVDPRTAKRTGESGNGP
jgi:uncharacterized protein YutE (UPF0331/DUF86 family)